MHQNIYVNIRIRGDIMQALEKETIKKSQENKKLTSKTKMLEQILKERYNIKDNEIYKKSLVS